MKASVRTKFLSSSSPLFQTPTREFSRVGLGADMGSSISRAVLSPDQALLVVVRLVAAERAGGEAGGVHEIGHRVVGPSVADGNRVGDLGAGHHDGVAFHLGECRGVLAIGAGDFETFEVAA